MNTLSEHASTAELPPTDMEGYACNAIAIIGMACRLPDDINTPDQCWQALVENKNLIHPISSARQKLCPPLSASIIGEAGCINDIDCFDAAFFQLSPREAQWLEPQQRLLLEMSWAALESAAISVKKEGGKANGVFIGITDSEYADLLENYSPDSVDAYFGTGNINAMAAGRLAYYYDWHGPAISIDTACSSSLVAIHMACRSLLNNECNLALAGGIHLLLDDKRFIAYRHAGMLSPTHRCKTFDDSADGYVRSEGGAVFVLKRLQDALNDNDPVQAIIRGSAINQDGRGQGLTAPNALAQQAVIAAALEQAGLPPDSILYLEAHGTGTPLGDPTEVKAAAEILCQQRSKDKPLLIGANKSLFGHQEAAAGAVGLLKTILSIQRGVLPGQLNFSTPNHRVPWSQLSVQVVDKNQSWPEGKKRAGISSFGFSGTNAHMVVEEYRPEKTKKTNSNQDIPAAIILSAKKTDALLEKCAQLLSYLQAYKPDIHDLAYTLQTGRDEMNIRCGFSACTIEEVKERLQEILKSDLTKVNSEHHFFFGNIKSSVNNDNKKTDKTETDDALKNRDFNFVIDRWVQGEDINWELFYEKDKPNRLSLPAYPFSSGRYWFTNPVKQEEKENDNIYSFNINPVSESKNNFHSNITFSGDEWFLKEHKIKKSRIMPGAAQLALVRTVASKLWGDLRTFHLYDVVWLRPVVCDSPVELHIDFIDEAEEITKYELYSFIDDERLTYSQGYISRQNIKEPSQGDLSTLLSQCYLNILKNEFYEKINSIGMEYGPHFEVLENIYLGEDIAVGKFFDPAAIKNFIWPLNIIDGALQTEAVFVQSKKNTMPMPFSIKDMQVWEPIPLTGWVFAASSSDDTVAVRKLDITVMDETGRVAVKISGFSIRFGKEDPVTSPSNSGVQAMHTDNDNSLTDLDILKSTLRGLIAEHLKMSEEELDDETPLSEYGFDSITITSFSHLLNQRYGASLSATVLYEAPTVAALADYLRQEQPSLVTSLTGSAGNGQAAQQQEGRTEPQPATDTSAAEQPQSAATPSAQQKKEPAADAPAAGPELEAVLRALIAEHLKMPEEELDDETPLSEYGFDSITITSFSHLLNQRYGASLSATVLYEAPTVAALADYLRQEQPKLVASLTETAGNGQAAQQQEGRTEPQPATDTSAAEQPQSAAPATQQKKEPAADAPAAGPELEAVLRALIAEHLKMPEEELDDETPLSEYGFDSITITSFSHLLNQRYGASLSATVLYEAPTVAALADYLRQEQPKLVASLTETAGNGQAAGADTPAAEQLQSAAPAVQQKKEPAADAPATAPELEAVLRALIAEHLKMPEEELDDETPLSEYGFDSITITSFSHLLNQRYGASLSATVLYEAPTVAALADYLRQEQPALVTALTGSAGNGQAKQQKESCPEQQTATDTSAPEQSQSATPAVLSGKRTEHTTPASGKAADPANEPIAIIGMSGCFPLAKDTDALWENLLAGRNCIRELPPDRWGGNPAPTIRYAGVIDGLEFFDPLFFGISPREAKTLEPHQRLLMQTVHNVIEEAGYSVESLWGSNTALLVATYTTGYRQLQELAGEPVESYSITSIVGSMGPNKMSHWLNWHGPSEPIETACSGSLVAIHRAVQLLRNGDCDQAVVGGVNALVTMDMHESLNLAGFLSPTGKCRVFSADADGYVRSEGAGMVFLKPLAAAERDGDHIYGLIKAIGLNHGGRSSSLTAPNVKAQSSLIERTLRHSGIKPDTVSYIEAHAAGTPVGDPIECQALKEAFTALDEGKNKQHQWCGLGSIKSNIGHIEGAAGMAGIIKVLLQMRHHKLVPSINSQPFNPKIDLANSPFYVVTEPQEWPTQKGPDGRALPLRAGINCFGFGGVNGHLILEEYISPTKEKNAPEQSGPVILVLSGRNKEALRLRAEQLCQVMQEETFDLAALAYTLQVGRDAMKARLALVVNSQEEAREKLSRFIKEEHKDNDSYFNQLKSLSANTTQEKRVPDYPASRDNLAQLAQGWVQGEMIDWSALYPAEKPQRLSLPTYPFAQTWYWVSEKKADDQSSSSSPPPRETDSQHQSHVIQITGEESWLDTLQVNGVPQMPWSIQLEWVRAAVCELIKQEVAVTLKQVLWLAPLKITAPQKIRIDLQPEGNGSFHYEVVSLNNEQTIHGRGIAQPNKPSSEAPKRINIATLRGSHRMNSSEGTEYYRRLQQTGIDYSQQAQLMIGCEIGELCVLGQLKQPKNSDAGGLLAILDNSLMLPAALGNERNELLALSSACIWQEFPDEIRAWCKPANISNKVMPGWDIQLFDKSGNILAELRGVTFQPPEPGDDPQQKQQPQRPQQKQQPSQKQNSALPPANNTAELLSATPHWRTFAASMAESPWPDDGPAVLWLSHEFENEDEQTLSQRFQAHQQLEHLVWEVPPGNPKNAIYGFRLLKSLLRAGWESKPLKLTLITRQAQALSWHESADPHQATLFGLMGSAAKEYPYWSIRLLDIPSEQSLRFTGWQNIPPDPRGWPQLWRNGQWYQRCLLSCQLTTNKKTTPYRQNGVVVILGGAGGVGKVFTEYLIRRANIQVIWLGRRAEDAVISRYRRDLGQHGPEPVYIQADATDRQQLDKAYSEITTRFGNIHGVVHSAIVLSDASLAVMSEQNFAVALTAKTLTTINLEAVFGKPDLDFFIFFSSIQSFVTLPGQSNYAAGCCFTDAFAHELRQRPYLTKTINWGYWGSVGIVATKKYRTIMARKGIGSIESEEAMPELERFVDCPLAQLILAKLSATIQQSVFGMSSETSVQILPAGLPVVLPHSEKISFPQAMTDALHALEDELAYQLWSILDDMGWMSSPASVPSHYKSWLNESLRLLRLSGVLSEEAAPPVQKQWQHWRSFIERNEIKDFLNPQLTMLNSTLKRLPEILQGQVPATEVLFPDGSFGLVEPVYSGEVMGLFNRHLTSQVETYIDECLKKNPDTTFRILEVGAGTGATSKGVFPLLAPYSKHIEEYCFTDLSKAFLNYAQDKYADDAEYLTTKKLNIEINPLSQKFEPGVYDIVIASNVLHATRNIQQTLGNIKLLLKQNGLLLLNELAETGFIAHLTFGLLDGWWLSEDQQIRSTGGPGLSSEQWETQLTQAGFKNFHASAEDAQELGFQIISANSDGVVIIGSDAEKSSS